MPVEKSKKSLPVTTTKKEVTSNPTVGLDSILSNMDLTEKILAVPEQFEHVWRYANVLSAGDLIPEHYRRKPNNCFMAVLRAHKLGVDPFFYMENTYVVGGRLACQGKLVIALANQSKKFKGSITFKMTGTKLEEKACTAYAVLAETGEKIEMTITYADAKRMGWTKPVPAYKWENGKKTKGGTTPSKWDLMFMKMGPYRSASWLLDLYAPEIMGGMQHLEQGEFEDDEFQIGEITPVFDRKENVTLVNSESEKESPAQEEKIPETEIKKVEKKEFPFDILDVFIKSNEISEESFNSYLYEKKFIQEGERYLALKSKQLFQITENLKDALKGYKQWKKDKTYEAQSHDKETK